MTGTEIVTETPDPVPARNARVTKLKLNVLDGLNFMLVKSHELIVMEHMTLNLKTVKENVVSKKIKLKVVEVQMMTEIETVAAPVLVPVFAKVTKSKPNVQQGPQACNTTELALYV